MNSSLPSETELTRIGTIEDVSGSKVSAVISESVNSGLVFVKGKGYRIGQPGSFIRVPIGYADLFGVVSQIGASAIPERFASSPQPSQRWMTIELIGEGTPRRGFSRGISQFPTVGDAVHIVGDEDLDRIYGRPDSPAYLSIGRIASSESIPALVELNKLVSRHSCIVGSTGSGKSTTVSGLLNSIVETDRFGSARILVIDIHGEYATALGDRASVFSVGGNSSETSSPLYLPYWALEFDELLPLTFGNVSSDADAAGIGDHIRSLKEEAIDNGSCVDISRDELSVDSPVPFSIHRLWYELHLLVSATHLRTGNQGLDTVAYKVDAQGNPADAGDAKQVRPPACFPQDTSAGAEPKVYLSQSRLNIRRALENLAYRLRDPRFSFLFKPGPWTPDLDCSIHQDLDVLLEAWIGGERPVSILDLSGVPREILNTVIGVLLRIVYDALFWARNLSEGARERPLLIVLEEAHAYVSPDDTGIAARVVRRIVREGRKYGIGVSVISQRPSEIDATVLSQCGTFFAMRLSNSRDRSQVSAAAPENLEGLFALLPNLRTGEAILVGEAVHIPMRVMMALPPANRRPDSEDPKVFEESLPGGWNRKREPTRYADVVKVWRQKNTQSPSLHSLDTGETDGMD